MMRDALDEMNDALAMHAKRNGSSTVADDATALVHGERAEQYGPPVEFLTRVGRMWGALLDRDPIPPRLVAGMMATFKLAREGGPGPKRDNLVDAVGYLLIAEMAGGADAVRTS